MYARTFLLLLAILVAVADVIESYSVTSRKTFVRQVVPASLGALLGLAVKEDTANAAPQIFNTPSGLKYAILKQPADLKKATVPAPGDIVAIEYTGYLANGAIFDATHAEGKGNALAFKLGEPTVIDGLAEMVENMGVGQKVQVIIPPKLAFGDKGLCLESGECLIQPGATLVYDVFLKRTAIPPP